MRRIGICCALSLLMFVGVGRAAPIGQHGSASSAGTPTVLLLGARAIEHGVGQISSGQAEAFPLAVRRAGSVSAVSVYVPLSGGTRSPVQRAEKRSVPTPAAGAPSAQS